MFDWRVAMVLVLFSVLKSTFADGSLDGSPWVATSAFVAWVIGYWLIGKGEGASFWQWVIRGLILCAAMSLASVLLWRGKIWLS